MTRTVSLLLLSLAAFGRAGARRADVGGEDIHSHLCVRPAGYDADVLRRPHVPGRTRGHLSVPHTGQARRRQAEQTYRAIYLENPYVQICVLPELGGRIFAAVDKTNGYDFFYRQHVIKPALIGMVGRVDLRRRGVEHPAPPPRDHVHAGRIPLPATTPTAARRSGWARLEWRHRMKWIVGLTLCTRNEPYLEVTIRAVQPHAGGADSFLCFANVAVHANADYQVIFPPGTEFGTQHAKVEFFRWPIARRRLRRSGLLRGVDVSWWKNHPKPDIDLRLGLQGRLLRRLRPRQAGGARCMSPITAPCPGRSSSPGATGSEGGCGTRC